MSEAVDLVTHPDINPVQQGLTSVNRREPVFSLHTTHLIAVTTQYWTLECGIKESRLPKRLLILDPGYLDVSYKLYL